MSFVENSESAQKRFEMGGGSQSSFTHTIDEKHDERWYRKTLPAKRLLKLNLKHLEKGLKWAKAGDIPKLTAHVAKMKCSFDDYTSQVCRNISDPSWRRDLIDWQLSSSSVALHTKRLSERCWVKLAVMLGRTAKTLIMKLVQKTVLLRPRSCLAI